MKQKQNFIILGVIGIAMVAFWVVVITLGLKVLRTPGGETDTTIVEATLCDEDNSGLCVVNFGANSLNRMVIHFRVPDETYAAFYVKATNRETVSVYACEADEADLTLIDCTGARTPLGEPIDLEIYATDGDQLIARGTFLVSAIAIPTPLSLPSEAPIEEAPTEGFQEEFPTEIPLPTEAPFIEEEPTLLPEEEPTTEPVSPPNP